MLFTATCPHCKAKFKASDEYVGKKGQCQKCGETFRIEKPDLITKRKIDSTEFEDDELEAEESIADVVSNIASDSFTVKPLVSPLFNVLKLMSILFAWAGVIWVIIGFVFSMYLWLNQEQQAIAAATFGACVFLSLPSFLVSELIHLVIQVEINTNRTANSIEQVRSILANRL